MKLTKDLIINRLKDINKLNKQKEISIYLKSKSNLKYLQNYNYKPINKEISNEESKNIDIMFNEIKTLNPIELTYFNLWLSDKNSPNDYFPKNYDLKQNFLNELYNYPDAFDTLLSSLGTGTSNNNIEESSQKEEVKEEKTSFDVKIKSFNSAKKLVLIKELKTILGLSLKDAKEKVDKVPIKIKEKALKEDAENLKKKLEEIGCEIELL